MIKSGGDNVTRFLHKLCTSVRRNRQWPDDWVKSIFVPISKKDDIQQCNNNRTIALISHCSRILLKIVAGRVKVKLEDEISEEQAGFRPGKSTRDQVLNLKMVIEKNREFSNNISLYFIDYNKAFDMVSHELLWNVIIKMGFSTHIVELIRNLYSEEKAAVRTTHDRNDWFKVKKKAPDRAAFCHRIYLTSTQSR